MIGGLRKIGDLAEEVQPARFIGGLQFFQEKASKQAQQDAHRQEEAGADKRSSACR
ncbi:hypothetical protein JQK88_28040 [Mesorhizobium caraganae]|nr:hypothetical protein [Mesorhizobium caraganae]